MTLKSKLDAFKEQFKQQAPEQAQETMSRVTNELYQSGILDNTIKIWDHLPSFTLPNQDGNQVSLEELLAKGPLVINVFRGVWCPFCSIELQALNNILPALHERRTNLVGLAPQLQPSARENKEKLALDFDILVDRGNEYAESLGLCYNLPEELIAIYKEFGIDLPSHNGDDSWRLPMPARLLIDQDFRLLYADINPDYTNRPEPEVLLEILDQRN